MYCSPWLGLCEQDEFFDFSRDMVKTGPDAFFSRIGRSAFVNTLVLPGASIGMKRVRVFRYYVLYKRIMLSGHKGLVADATGLPAHTCVVTPEMQWCYHRIVTDTP